MTIKAQNLTVGNISCPSKMYGQNVVKLQKTVGMAKLALPLGRLHQSPADGLGELQIGISVSSRVIHGAKGQEVARLGTIKADTSAVMFKELRVALTTSPCLFRFAVSGADVAAKLRTHPVSRTLAVAVEEFATALARLGLWGLQLGTSAAAKGVPGICRSEGCTALLASLGLREMWTRHPASATSAAEANPTPFRMEGRVASKANLIHV